MSEASEPCQASKREGLLTLALSGGQCTMSSLPVDLIVAHEDLLEARQVVQVGHGADQVAAKVELHQTVEAPQPRHVSQHVAREVQQTQLLTAVTHLPISFTLESIHPSSLSLCLVQHPTRETLSLQIIPDLPLWVIRRWREIGGDICVRQRTSTPGCGKSAFKSTPANSSLPSPRWPRPAVPTPLTGTEGGNCRSCLQTVTCMHVGTV
ncbi:hypothetical protein E2C01_002385 [Portunus trituberculatus]|uniref:Uncharacterized protein n=1 Tax=Portunus trituberculatus TaxID=210409 RepID=A0A5B7CKV0_PORTR|nr:hypothetical protein [Portunus trituberculatus]